jgi:signal transduction histidine kinase
VILDRLLIRQKLNLLIAIPLVSVALLIVPLLVGRVGQAQLAGDTATTAREVRQVGNLLDAVQRARLLAVGYLDAGLVNADDVQLALAAVTDLRGQLLADPDVSADPAVAQAVRGTETVNAVGARLVARAISDQEVLGADNSVAAALITALHLDRRPTSGSEQGWGLAAMGALLLADEAASRSGALWLVAAGNPLQRAEAEGDAGIATGIEAQQVEAFLGLASASEVAMFGEATHGAGQQRIADATAELGLAGAGAAQTDVARHVYAAVQSQTTLRQVVEAAIIQDVSRAAGQASTSALSVAWLLVALGLVLFAGVVGLSIRVGRSVSIPLRRLTSAAGSVADVAVDELANVEDDDAAPQVVRDLPALPVGGGDELGELAVAFNRVQATTARLLERQIVSRRNVAAMFAGIGRRTSNLVGRQLALIDMLESAEEDERSLRTLYRLDHLSTRLRRNASSLVVLSGDRGTVEASTPLALPDAVRAALGSVEDFQRVALGPLPDVVLAPSAASDIVLVLAELIENGLQYSPPHAHVEIAVWVSDDARYVVSVVDHGIGMSPERLSEENARLRQRERLDLSPTDVLGLFVVGRLSRRHEIGVTLVTTPGGGVTAHVLLHGSLIIDNPWTGSELQGVSARDARAQEAVAVPPMPSLAEQAMPQPAVPQARPQPAPAAPLVVEAVEAQANHDSVVEDDPRSGLRRRRSGTHWDGPPIGTPTAEPPAQQPVLPPAQQPVLPPAQVPALSCAQSPDQNPDQTPDQTPDHKLGNGVPRSPGDRIPASRVAAILDGHAAGPRQGGVAPRAPDPGATQREFEDLEAIWASVDPLLRTPPPPAPNAGAPAGPDMLQPQARPSDAGTMDLVRRVPGATLAALGAEIAVPQNVPAVRSFAIEADELLRTIVDVDEGMQRARTEWDGGGSRTNDGVSRWGGRMNGDGR